MATSKKIAKKQYIPEGAIVRTYYFSKKAMDAFEKKFEELGKMAVKNGERIPKRHELASKLFAMADSIDVKEWFN